MTGRGQFPRQKQNVPRGTQLNNMFEIDELVTAGGMGEVYRGHNIQTNDPVAIKIVLPEFAEDEMILELFRKEARILNHLHHEAIVRYYVFSIDAALKLPFLAMEFVDGPSLAERIKQGPLDTASVVTLQRHLADGLEKAHQAGVIHRDIAPDNIILPDGRVDRAKIIDFGIARSAAVGGGTLLGGQFAGKYGFVSPEQLGLFGGDVTNRSDIYSLGLVLAACVLGRPLNMSGSQVEVIEKRRAVPDLTGIEPPLRDLIEAMLQPDPQDRPQSMAEVADWSTYEEPEPDDERTRVPTSPPIRHPTRHSTRQPSRQPSRPPTSHPPRPQTKPPSQPPAEARETSPPPPLPPPAPPRVKPVGRRREKAKSRPGLIAGGIALAAILLAGVGGWAYVEYWSGAWYEDQSRTDAVVAEPQPPRPATDESVAATEPQPPPPATDESPAATEPEPPPPATDESPAATEPEPSPPAAVETPAATEPEPPPFTLADIRSYVNSYDGGSCFFAFPAQIGDRRAEIIGYGNRREDFDALRAAFQQRFGFEAAIELRQVSEPQCIVVEALGKLTTQGAQPPVLDLNQGILRSGETLQGTVSGFGGRHLAVVMLDNYGFVHNLAGFVTRDDDVVRFNIPLHLQNPMDFEPQLVVSVASAEPLRSLDLEQYVAASDLISSLLEEIASKPEGLATTVGYFKFGS
jgi:serine/threonine-protein kinase